MSLGDGWAFWVDEYSKAPVIHNWGNARNAAYGEKGEALMVLYFQNKLENKFKYNKTVAPELKIKMTAGFDETEGNVLLTFSSSPMNG